MYLSMGRMKHKVNEYIFSVYPGMFYDCSLDLLDFSTTDLLTQLTQLPYIYTILFFVWEFQCYKVWL